MINNNNNIKPITLLSGSIDFKWNETQGIKILEIQSASRSGSKGFDTLPENKDLPMEKHIYDCMLSIANKYKLELAIEENYFRNTISTDPHQYTTINTNDILSLNQKVNKILFLSKDIENSGLLFSHLANQWPSFSNLVACCIIQKLYPNIVVASGNATTQALFEDKVVTDYLCKKHIPGYYPESTILFLRKDDKKNHDKITQVSERFKPYNYVVIKPTNGCQGQGVLVIKSEQLEEVLTFFLQDNQEQISQQLLNLYMSASPKTKAAMDYWRHLSPNNGYSIVIQELIYSNALQIQNNDQSDTVSREPTYRIFFSVINGQLIIHGGYAKLAPEPLNQGEINTDSFVSEIPQDPQISSVSSVLVVGGGASLWQQPIDRSPTVPFSATIDVETFEKMKKQFEGFLPTFVDQLLQTDFNELLTELIKTNPDHLNYLIKELGCYSLGALNNPLLECLKEIYQTNSSEREAILSIFYYHFFNRGSDFTPALFDFFADYINCHDHSIALQILHMKNRVFDDQKYKHPLDQMSTLQKEALEKIAVLSKEKVMEHFSNLTLSTENAFEIFMELTPLLQKHKHKPNLCVFYGAHENEIRQLMQLCDDSKKIADPALVRNFIGDFNERNLLSVEDAIQLYCCTSTVTQSEIEQTSALCLKK